jgi:GTP-binding protein
MPKKEKKNITIIGECGVGKSKLFEFLSKNFFAEKESFKTSPDINNKETDIKIDGQIYKLIDTPSFFVKNKEKTIKEKIEEKIRETIKSSELVLWVVDSSKEIGEKDILINNFIKRNKIKEIILVANKSDIDSPVYSCKSLGIKEFCLVSLVSKRNLTELLKKIKILLEVEENDFEDEEEIKETEEDKEGFNLVIFGPPNSGKSTLMNCLLKENKSLASPISGTTKEPVVGKMLLEEKNFKLVDTAGITKEEKLAGEL